MLRYVKHHLETIVGIEIFPLISLLIFFIFFTVLIIYVIKLKKSDIEEISNIPLNENSELQ
ncbi:MAG: CcoQ/FixQ family Cbb3-type cytochrome c oxidase assembly chaperone [bacterium]|nr:CcoQ/FixQ family Cbb3-type cytochrome c oxidase assembly chaperone [bacterium]